MCVCVPCGRRRGIRPHTLFYPRKAPEPPSGRGLFPMGKGTGERNRLWAGEPAPPHDTSVAVPPGPQSVVRVLLFSVSVLLWFTSPLCASNNHFATTSIFDLTKRCLGRVGQAILCNRASVHLTAFKETRGSVEWASLCACCIALFAPYLLCTGRDYWGVLLDAKFVFGARDVFLQNALFCCIFFCALCHLYLSV